jgi:hypothetical protein
MGTKMLEKALRSDASADSAFDDLNDGTKWKKQQKE